MKEYLEDKGIKVGPAESEDKIREMFKSVFLGDVKVNPDHKSPDEYFNPKDEKSLKKNIIEARLKMGLRSSLPLRQLVAIGELASVYESDELRARYKDIFSVGAFQDILKEYLEKKYQYEERDLKFFIHNQSPEIFRSLVELGSNAVDFSEPGSDVTIDVDDYGYVVKDHGQGMSMRELVEQLCIPFMSGSRKNTKTPIGKFGVGFFTVLRHLKEEGDIVLVETGQDGQAGVYIEMTIKNGEVIARVGEQNDHCKGTRVSVVSSDFINGGAISYLKDHLQYKRGSNIILNGIGLEPPNDMKFIDSIDSYIGCVPGKEEVGECNLVIGINGVSTMNFKLTGENLPSELMVSLPFAADLSESRDSIVYDEVIIEAGKLLVDKLFEESETSVKNKIQTANGLAELFFNFERFSHTMDESLLSYLEERLKVFCATSKIDVIPALKEFKNINCKTEYMISTKMPAVYEQFFRQCERTNAFKGSGFFGYLVDFNENAEQFVIKLEDKIIIDRKLYNELRDYPNFIGKYINNVIRDEYVLFSKEKESENNEGKPIFTDNAIEEKIHTKTARDQLVETATSTFEFSQYSWNYSILHPKIIVGENSEIAEGYYRWYESLSISETIRLAIHNFLNGKADTIDFSAEMFEDVISEHKRRLSETDFSENDEQLDSRNQYYEGIRNLINRKDEIIASLSILRKFVIFFSPENMNKYLSMYGNAETELSAAFYVEFKDNFPLQFEEAKKTIVLNRKYTRDGSRSDFSIDDVPINFNFVEEVLRKILFKKENNLFNRKMDLSEEILSMHEDKLKKKLTALRALTKLHETEVEMSDEKKEIFNRLLKINWEKISGIRSDGISGLSRVLRATNTNYMDFDNFSRSLNGLRKLVEAVPAELLLKFIYFVENNSVIDGVDLSILIFFLVRPHDFFMMIMDSEFGYIKRENSFQIMGDENDDGRGIDEKYGKKQFDIGWRYSWLNISTIDELNAHIEDLAKKAGAGLISFMDNYEWLYSLPQLRELFSRSGKQILDERRQNDGGSFYDGFKSFSSYQTLKNFNNSFIIFSDQKKLAIQEFLEERFSEDKYSRESNIALTNYLDRVLLFAGLTDDEFIFIQPWLATPSGMYGESSFGDSFVDVKIIQVLLERRKDISSKNCIDEVIKIWKGVIKLDRHSKRIEDRVNALGRVIDIVIDINARPKYLRDFIYQYLIDGHTTLGSTAFEDYNLLSQQSKIKVSDINSLVQPYVIYFKSEDAYEELNSSRQINFEADGEHGFELSKLMHLARIRSTEFNTLVADYDGLEDAVNSESQGTNRFIYYRELLHAINHLPSNDEFLFIREMLQNAYDAAEGSEDRSVPSILNIFSFSETNMHFTLVADDIGMKPEDVFSKLLIPGATTKKEGKSLGRFGIGFMSLFKNAQRVEINTSRGGEGISLSATPIYNEQNEMMDIQINYSMTTGKKDGTSIKKFKKSDNGQLESAKLQASVNRYGSYLDQDVMRILCDGVTVNPGREVLSEIVDERVGLIQILDGSELLLLQGRLYVTDLPDYFFKFVPPDLLDLVKRSDLVINVDKSVELTRSRKDLAKKEELAGVFSELLPGMIIKSVITKAQRGKFNLQLIPSSYLYLTNPYDDIKDLNIDFDIMMDAEKINAGKGLNNWTKYSDKQSLLILITLMKTIPLDGEMVSLLDISQKYWQGYKFDEKELPSYVKKLIDREVRQNEDQNKLVGKYNSKEVPNLKPTLFNLELEKLLTLKSDAHIMFFLLIKLLSHDRIFTNDDFGVRNVFSGDKIYIEDSRSSGSVSSVGVRSWNLLHFERVVEMISSYIKEGRSNDVLLYNIMSEIADTITYLDVYGSREVSISTPSHSDEFIKAKIRKWNSILGDHQKISTIFREISRQFSSSRLTNEKLVELLG